MKHTAPLPALLRSELERELQIARQNSLIAMRKGDYLAVARLTSKVAQLNKNLEEMASNLRSSSDFRASHTASTHMASEL